MASPDEPLRVVVRRDRHGWPPGYFDSIVRERIPFPLADGSHRAGVLASVRETAEHVELRFEEVGAEG